MSRCVTALRGDGEKHIETVILPDGEQYKSLDILTRVWDKALEARLDRKSTFVALGGGVIGDMAGFGAAAYQRGVAFIQVWCWGFCSTTLFAMPASSCASALHTYV